MATSETQAPAVAQSTQEANPRQAVQRTMLAAVIAFFPLINGVLLSLQGWLAENSEVLPPGLVIGVNGVLVAGLLLVALVTRLLAVPGVNDWLRKYAKVFATESVKGRHVA